MPNLRDVSREFSRGAATLDTLRNAARAEPTDRQLAAELLRLIAEWEAGAWTWTDSGRAKSELRWRVKQLVPPPAPPPTPSRRPPGESMYDAGLRGQRRRG